MEYKVKLKRTSIEDFEKDRNNTAILTLQAKDSFQLPKTCEVKLFLSKNATLGLGKSLIRYAHEKRKVGHHWHLDPIRPNESLVQTLGIYVLPDSVEPIVGSNDNGNINNSIQENIIYEYGTESYNFPLEHEYGTIEDFEKDDDNVALFRVFDGKGNDVSEQCRYILIWLNTNAMLGLGTELIRLAHNFEEGKTVNIEPVTAKEAKQSMGIFLTPESCELTIECKSFDPIEKYLEKYEQEQKDK